MGIHYFMFYCLIDPKGLDVEENPPNELYIKIMIVSIVLTFISWILLLVLFPPVAGGGGGGKGGKKGGSSGSSRGARGRSYYIGTHYTSRYRTYGNYGRDTSEGAFPKEKVQAEWEAYGLDETKNERDDN